MHRSNAYAERFVACRVRRENEWGGHTSGHHEFAAVGIFGEELGVSDCPKVGANSGNVAAARASVTSFSGVGNECVKGFNWLIWIRPMRYTKKDEHLEDFQQKRGMINLLALYTRRTTCGCQFHLTTRELDVRNFTKTWHTASAHVNNPFGTWQRRIKKYRKPSSLRTVSKT